MQMGVGDGAPQLSESLQRQPPSQARGQTCFALRQLLGNFRGVPLQATDDSLSRITALVSALNVANGHIVGLWPSWVCQRQHVFISRQFPCRFLPPLLDHAA
jgi:hypothetical protein